MVSPSSPPAPDKQTRVLSLHHVQITIPVDAEEAARSFYVGLLGLTEIPKPTSLAGRGGLWLAAGPVELHIGTEDGVDRSRSKAHIALTITDLPSWRAKLEAAGLTFLESIPIPGYERIETRDPFGNRLELIEAQTRD